MSVPLTIQGVTFQYPVQYDNNWGPTLTAWSTAVTNAITPLLSGGTLQVSPYPGAVVNFANATNSGFLPLAINGSNQLTFNGAVVNTLTLPITVSEGGTGDTTLTAYSVLCGGTTSTSPVQSVSGLGSIGQALVSNGPSTLPSWQNVAGSGTVNTGTAGHLSYYASTGTVLSDAAGSTLTGTYTFSGLTNFTNRVAIANTNPQLFLSSSNGNGIQINAGTPAGSSRTVSFPDPGNDCNFILSEGTQTINTALTLTNGILGANLNANSNKIVNLSAGTTNGDSLRYEQLIGQYLLLTGGTLSGNLAMGSNKITGLASGTAATDAPTFSQIKVIQLVFASSDTNTSTTSSSYQTTTLSANITPTNASNHILILAVGNIATDSSGDVGYATIYSGSSTNLGPANGFAIIDSPSSAFMAVPATLMWADLPGSTSNQIYTVYIKSSGGASTSWGNGSRHTILLAEVVY